MTSDPRAIARPGRPLVGLGQVSLDRVGQVAGRVERGAKRRLRAQELLPGGQMATALLAAARLGAPTRLIAAVGDDAAAELALAPLAAAGVGLSDVRRIRGCGTRQAWVLVEEPGGERTILEWRPAALRLPPAPVAAEVIRGAGVLLLDVEHPEASAWAATTARAAGVPIVLDADRCDEASLALARQVDFPIVSRVFAEELSSDASLGETLRMLTGPGTRAQLAVVTCGAEGAVACRAGTGGARLEIPPFAVAAVDTTGAGDVFRGTFAWALLAGEDPEQALHTASAAASLACLGRGAQGALPDREALRAHRESARRGR